MIRLIMSIDIVGSTLYKATANNRNEGWVSFFKKFYADFPILFNGHAAEEFRLGEESRAVTVWKCLGDELLMVAEPKSIDEVARLMCALSRTMAFFERDRLQRLPLRLKAAAWFAAFPDPNIEIVVPGLFHGKETVHADYIGPDIDLGFRIAKFAAPSMIVASLPLVEVLLDSAHAKDFDFYVVGRESLKGILFGRSYPIIWVRPSGERLEPSSWEIEDNPLISIAKETGLASATDIRAMIADMRQYLMKMHDVNMSPVEFPPA